MLAALAGSVAAAGVMYRSGLEAEWLERFHLGWRLNSERLAERGYEQLLGGDREGALELFELAVERDPASPYRWCDLGEARLAAGDEAGAREAMARGMERGEYIGPVAMRGVNFAYRVGDQGMALEYGKRLLGMTPAYDDAVFTVWERMECPAGEVLERGIPDERAAGAYVRRLARQGNAEAARAWEWAAARGYVDDRLADEYAGFLVRAGRGEEAVRAWAGYMALREPGYPENNAVFNGGFEREPAGRVLDWRIDPVEGVRVEREAGGAAEGEWSLRLRFEGKENLAYGQVRQVAAVGPGEWVLRARVRAEGITTDEGVRLRVVDAEAPRRLDVRTEAVTGSCGWREIGVRFVVGAGTRTVRVEVFRQPSLKFDNRLKGTVWIDAVRLQHSIHTPFQHSIHTPSFPTR